MKILFLKQKSYIVESILYLALICVASFALPESFWGWWRSDPHPFLFLIFFFALRYGIKGAMKCAFVSLAFFFASAIFVKENPISLYALKYTILFLAVAWIFGEMVRRKQVEEKRIKDENADFKNKNKRLEDENSIYRRINTELEERVLASASTFGHVFNTIKNVRIFDSAHNYDHVLESVKQYTSAQECSLYMLSEEDILSVKARSGSDSTLNRRDTIRMDRSLLCKSILDKRAYSIRDFVGPNVDQLDVLGESVMAAPLVDRRGDVFGVINIERMPFLKVTQPVFEVFSQIANWASHVIKESELFIEIKQKSLKDPALDLFKRDYFLMRLEEEFIRSKNFDLHFCIIRIKAKFPVAKAEVEDAVHRKFFVEVIISKSEKYDICAVDKEKDAFLMLLPGSKKADAEKKLKTFEKTFEKVGIKVSMAAQICEFTKRMKNFHSMLQKIQ